MYSVLDTELVSGTLYTNVSGIAVLAILKKPKNNRKKSFMLTVYICTYSVPWVWKVVKVVKSKRLLFLNACRKWKK